MKQTVSPSVENIKAHQSCMSETQGPGSIGCASVPEPIAIGWSDAANRTDASAVTAALAEQVRLFEAALENMRQGLCMFDAQSRLVVSNRRYHEMFGIPFDAIHRGMTQADICTVLIARGCYSHSATLEKIVEDTRFALQANDGLPILRELADGRIVSVIYHIMKGGGWVSTFEDVTDRYRNEARVAHLAHHDPLTDLVNSRTLRSDYHDLISIVDEEQPIIALLYLDLDRFKFINDTYGHAAGDALLQAVAERLRANTRRGDIVARLGGDEFAVVLRVVDEATALTAAQRLVTALSEPYHVACGRLDVTASIGLALRTLHDPELDPFLYDGDLALRHAKAEGRGKVRLFDPSMSEVARARSALEAELRTALTEDQFEVHYQTLVDIHERRVIGVEALVRWRHPTRGLVPPITFITVMEEIGLIIPLGHWVLERACRDAMRWPDHIVVAVNVSSVQMRQKSFGESVLNILTETGLPSRRLEIEITESSLMEESEITRANFGAIHDAGIRIAVDDFGTGYSSLSYLRRFPIDKIKIDRSFMKDIETSDDARAIVRAVVSLGTSLGITTLAEGIETESQLDVARLEGIGQVQGYYFSRPQPEEIVSRAILESTALPVFCSA